jgi:FkbM family methyltransferase
MISIRAKLERFSFRHRLITRNVSIRNGHFRVFAWHPRRWHIEDAVPLSWMLDRIGPDEVLFDIGANRGYYSLSVLANVPRARVCSFEPNPDVFMMLKRNIELNGVGDRAEAVGVALGDRVGEAKLFVALADSASSLNSDHSTMQGQGIKKEVGVEIVTLDELIFGRRFPVPGHVKIDTEGFEGPILRGGIEFLRMHAPVLYLEIHSKDGKSDNEEEIRSALRPFDYRILKEGKFLLCLPGRS